MQKLTGAAAKVGGLVVGQGVPSASLIKKILAGTFVLDIASIAGATSAEQSVTITGVAVGDLVIVMGPDAGLSVAVAITQAFVSAADTVKFRVVNPTAGALDPASATFRYLWIDLT
jgi:hypothetical protein